MYGPDERASLFLGLMSVDCDGLASAWFDAAGFIALTMASKLPSAKRYQRWVFSELAEQMNDMLPISALFIHFCLSDSLSVLRCSISLAALPAGPHDLINDALA